MAKLSEIEAAFAMLDTIINSVLDALDGLSAEELNWKPPVADGNSALVIATHVVGASQGHILQTLCGQSIDRDREEEFRASGDSAAPLRAAWEMVGARLSEALDSVDGARLDATHEHPILGPMTGHTILAVGIRHAAEHLGHISLTRALILAQRS